METVIKFTITIFLAAVIIALLPNSPFAPIIQGLSEFPYLGYLNYFIPVGRIITITTAWAGACLTYFCVSWVLRQLDIVGA